MNVPLNGGNAYARAAGVLPFMPPDAPDAFADYRAPASFGDRYAYPTPNHMLRDNYVLEGIARLGRMPAEGVTDFLFDVDDLSEGEQWVRADGRGQLAPGGDPAAFRPGRPTTPLRWFRASRRMMSPVDEAVWPSAMFDISGGVSGVLNAMIRPNGEHGFDAVNDEKVWDEGEYLANLIGWYFASQGRELLYQTNPAGHHCLEDSSCMFGR